MLCKETLGSIKAPKEVIFWDKIPLSPIGKVLKILGIALIIYAIITGFHFHFSMSDGEFEFNNNYKFKVGSLIVGVILIVLGKKAQEN